MKREICRVWMLTAQEFSSCMLLISVQTVCLNIHHRLKFEYIITNKQAGPALLTVKQVMYIWPIYTLICHFHCLSFATMLQTTGMCFSQSYFSGRISHFLSSLRFWLVLISTAQKNGFNLGIIMTDNEHYCYLISTKVETKRAWWCCNLTQIPNWAVSFLTL